MICDFCKKEFVSVLSLNQHIRGTHKPKGKYECFICDKIYSYERGLLSHNKLVHIDETYKTYECNYCGIKYSDKYNLKKHILNMHGNSNFKCEKCARKFNSKDYLKKHLNTVHALSKTRYQCEYCSKSFAMKHGREIHIKTIHQNVRLNCDLCPKDYSSKQLLKAHKKLKHVNGNKEDLFEHKCDSCEKLFFRLNNLKSHVLLHNFS